MTDVSSWPNLFILGPPRAGTTSLYTWLSLHPEIFMSAVKEPRWFTGARYDPSTAHGRILLKSEEEYLSLFRAGAGKRWRGEATPVYFFTPGVPERIREKRPDARLILLLRDPVERAVSHYKLAIASGMEKLPFGEAIRTDEARRASPIAGPPSGGYVDGGRYATHLERFLRVFPREQILVLSFDRFRDDRAGMAKELADFLGVSLEGFSKWNGEDGKNAAVVARGGITHRLFHSRAAVALRRFVPARWRGRIVMRVLFQPERVAPQLDPAVGRELVSIYAPEVARLETMLGRPLPELRRTWARYQ